MKLEELKTWDDLQDYLLDRMEYATEDISNANSNFTKKQVWDSLIDQSLTWIEQDLPIRNKDLLIKGVKKDFGMSI